MEVEKREEKAEEGKEEKGMRMGHPIAGKVKTGEGSF